MYDLEKRKRPATERAVELASSGRVGDATTQSLRRVLSAWARGWLPHVPKELRDVVLVEAVDRAVRRRGALKGWPALLRILQGELAAQQRMSAAAKRRGVVDVDVRNAQIVKAWRDGLKWLEISDMCGLSRGGAEHVVHQTVTTAEWDRHKRTQEALRQRTITEWQRRRTEWETQHGRPFPDEIARAGAEARERERAQVASDGGLDGGDAASGLWNI